MHLLPEVKLPRDVGVGVILVHTAEVERRLNGF